MHHPASGVTPGSSDFHLWFAYGAMLISGVLISISGLHTERCLFLAAPGPTGRGRDHAALHFPLSFLGINLLNTDTIPAGLVLLVFL